MPVKKWPSLYEPHGYEPCRASEAFRLPTFRAYCVAGMGYTKGDWAEAVIIVNFCFSSP